VACWKKGPANPSYLTKIKGLCWDSYTSAGPTPAHALVGVTYRVGRPLLGTCSRLQPPGTGSPARQNDYYGAARADHPDTSITDQNGGSVRAAPDKC